MVNSRCCSRTACKQPPVYTLTYVYKDSTAVLGPLAAYVDPHSWDLCEMHAARLVVPRGWDVVRLPPDPAQERADDLEALANIVRDVSRAERAAAPRPAAQQYPAAQEYPAAQQYPAAQPRQAAAARQAPPAPRPGSQPRPAAAEPVGQGVEVGRRGHLRVVRSAPPPES
ncbi:MAG TPA: DUF3499 domain-containing protein [Trebonia sp.]|nr:DUF3499 domain-containing protein [Trebonia sp.]